MNPPQASHGHQASHRTEPSARAPDATQPRSALGQSALLHQDELPVLTEIIDGTPPRAGADRTPPHPMSETSIEQALETWIEAWVSRWLADELATLTETLHTRLRAELKTRGLPELRAKLQRENGLHAD